MTLSSRLAVTPFVHWLCQVRFPRTDTSLSYPALTWPDTGTSRDQIYGRLRHGDLPRIKYRGAQDSPRLFFALFLMNYLQSSVYSRRNPHLTSALNPCVSRPDQPHPSPCFTQALPALISPTPYVLPWLSPTLISSYPLLSNSVLFWLSPGLFSSYPLLSPSVLFWLSPTLISSYPLIYPSALFWLSPGLISSYPLLSPSVLYWLSPGLFSSYPLLSPSVLFWLSPGLISSPATTSVLSWLSPALISS